MLHIIKNYRELFLGLVETGLSRAEKGGNISRDAERAALLGVDLATIDAVMATTGKVKDVYLKEKNTIDKKNTKKRNEIKKASTVERGNINIFVGLKKGVRGRKDEVKKLQELLVSKGYNTNGIDGKFGNGTLGALKAYQVRLGVTATGEFNNATFNAVKKDLGIAQRSNDTVKGNERVQHERVQRRNIVTKEKIIEKKREAKENYDAMMKTAKEADCQPELMQEIQREAQEILRNNYSYWNNMLGKNINFPYNRTGGYSYDWKSPCEQRIAKGLPCTPTVEEIKVIQAIHKAPKVKRECSVREAISNALFGGHNQCVNTPLPEGEGDGNGNGGNGEQDVATSTNTSNAGQGEQQDSVAAGDTSETADEGTSENGDTGSENSSHDNSGL